MINLIICNILIKLEIFYEVSRSFEVNTWNENLTKTKPINKKNKLRNVWVRRHVLIDGRIKIESL